MCGISTGGWAYHLFLLEDREAEGFSSISWVWYQSEGRCWSEIFGLRHISEVFVVFKNRVNILVLAQIEALRCLFFEKLVFCAVYQVAFMSWWFGVFP